MPKLFESIVLPTALSTKLAHYPASFCMSCLTSSNQSPRIREAKPRSFADAEAGEDGVEEGVGGY